MHTFILDYINYNAWANKLLLANFSQYSEEILSQELNSSFPSIKKTILHIWDAQVIWLKRLQGLSLGYFPSRDFQGKKEDYFEGLMNSSEEFVQFWMSLKEDQVQSICTYQNTKGVNFEQTFGQIVLHCMNHSTYHRGQLITLGRHLGFNNLPATDYIAYLRKG